MRSKKCFVFGRCTKLSAAVKFNRSTHYVYLITLIFWLNFQNLITIAVEKITECENRGNQSEGSLSNRCSHCSTISSDQSQCGMSLSEMTMSPYERQLLELTTKRVLEKHLSTQSTRNEVESTPPPKPPLPDGWISKRLLCKIHYQKFRLELQFFFFSVVYAMNLRRRYRQKCVVLILLSPSIRWPSEQRLYR